jgi:hypothetical protein
MMSEEEKDEERKEELTLSEGLQKRAIKNMYGVGSEGKFGFDRFFE